MGKKQAEIKGGATLWSRQTIDSKIFYDKPDKWFKIWFYLVNRASHEDTKKYKRGETFFQQSWISEATGATPDQVKKCFSWMRKVNMISTRRSTKGTWLLINKYHYFQTLDNYFYDVKAPDKALEKHEGSTKEARRYNKNDKNDKNEKNIYMSYKEKINSGSRLTDSAKKKIKNRLKTFSEKELLEAINKFSESPWWVEHNSQRGVAWFFNSDDRIDQFLNLKTKSNSLYK